MRRAPRYLLLLWAALCACSLLRAEILREEREDEVVAVYRSPEGRPAERAEAPPAPRAAPTPAPPREIADLLQTASSKHGFDPALVRAVVLAESGFDPMAVSEKGARGLMQLMPRTAAHYGIENVHDPGANLDAGLAYLREMVARHGGDMRLALAAYNAGPESVAKYGGIPPYRETIRYIETIRRVYGDDLDAGDWSGRRVDIRLSGIEEEETPHYTNLPSRRILGRSGARAPAHQRPGVDGEARR